ncbi:helix-turn-helix domain-containing protein [Pedobacter sp. PWIIR3]
MNKLDSSTVFDLEYFFQITPDLVCIAGFDGYFKKINPAVSKTLGYSDAELFAVPIASFIHPDDHATTASKRTALINGEALLNFENRYLTKDGNTVWLCWTSVPVMHDEVVFAIAKDISYKKQLEEYERVSSILEMINDDHVKRFKPSPKPYSASAIKYTIKNDDSPSNANQLWLNSFEGIVRKHAGQPNLNLAFISNELAVSQRQLFRQVEGILGITPNKLVRIIRLQLAWEAIASGKYRTIKEISNIAGYSSRTHFSKLFTEVYGINVTELL